MLAVSIQEFKYDQAERHKQAEHYRLVRSLQKPHQGVSLILHAVGRMLILSGQQMIASSRAVS